MYNSSISPTTEELLNTDENNAHAYNKEIIVLHNFFVTIFLVTKQIANPQPFTTLLTK